MFIAYSIIFWIKFLDFKRFFDTFLCLQAGNIPDYATISTVREQTELREPDQDADIVTPPETPSAETPSVS